MTRSASRWLVPVGKRSTALSIILVSVVILGCSGESDSGLSVKDQYLMSLASQARPMLDSQDELTYLLITDTRSTDDSNWKQEVRDQLEIWRHAYEDAKEFEPPEDLLQMHDKYLEGLGLYASASNDISDWLDAPNSNLIDLGVDKISRGGLMLLEAGAILATIEGLPTPPISQSR